MASLAEICSRIPLSRSCLRALAIAALAATGACTYGGGIDRPGIQKATWFSYLNGDDIRSSCAPGALPHYRMVYNGAYNEQIRSYEAVGDGAGGAYLTARVQTGRGIDLSRLSIANPQASGGWTAEHVRLTPDEMAELEAALGRSGAFGPAPDGLRLASEEFYWILVGCRDGQIYFNAWLYPSDGFAALAFPAVLLRHDATGIALNPPRKVAFIDRSSGGGLRESAAPRFDLHVGTGGLRGLRPLL